MPRKALLLFILFAIIGLIYIYPDLRFTIESGNRYKGVGFTGTPEELLYLSRINGIYKGSVNLSDIYCFEHQNDPWFRPFIGEFIIGNIGKMLKVSVVNLDILSSAILTSILAFLIFIFSYQLSGSFGLSIVSSFAVMLGYNILTANILTLKGLFITGNYSKPLWFLRPVSPQFYYIPFLISLIYTNRAMSPSANKSDITIAGATLGLLFYCNLYYWTFIYSGLAILLLLFFLTKEKSGISRVFYIYALSIIIAIPYLISVFKVISHPAYKDLQRTYMIFGSHKVFLYAPYMIPAVLISILLMIFKHRSRFFIISFLAGGFMCINQQVLTGRTTLQQWSFYTNKTFLLISIIVTAGMILNRLRNPGPNLYKKALFAIILFLFVTVALLEQNNYYLKNKAYFLDRQKSADAYKWLRENTNKSDVVLTDPYLDFNSHLSNYRFLLTYTNNFSYIAEPACMLIREEEVARRILASLIFLGYGEDDVEKYIITLKEFYSSADPGIWVSKPSEEHYGVMRAAYKALKEENPVDTIRIYKINYILLEKEAAFKLEQKFNKSLTEVYKDNHFAILCLKT